jgi:hypothetical protein
MKWDVEEVQGEQDKPIALRFEGDDVSFIVGNGNLSIYLSEEVADSLAFAIGALLQDRDIRGKTNKTDPNPDHERP